MYFLPMLQQETGSRKDCTTQRGRSPCFPRVLAHIRMGKAQLLGHELAGGDEARVCRGGRADCCEPEPSPEKEVAGRMAQRQ